jgi:hypothetical protein
MILAFFGSRLSVSYRTRLTGCARDNGTGGGSGIFRWAKRIGIAARHLDVPVWEASQALERTAGNCVLTVGDGEWSPVESELDPVEWQSIVDWLSRGNALVIVTAAPRSLPRTLQENLGLSNFGETGAQRIPFLPDPTVPSRPETRQARLTSGEALEVEAKGPRWNASAPPPPSTFTPGASKTKPASVAKASDPTRWQLAGDADGGVLFRFPVGRGAVYILLDEFAWTNTGFDQGDNARVLAGVLGREIRDGVLAFDEYRHGHGRTDSFLVYLFHLPGSTAFLWLGAIWALFYVYGHNVRLKPVEPFVERQRRTAQEYIDAVAQLYERARAAPLVVEAVARRLRQVARSRAERLESVEAILKSADRYTNSQDRPAVPTAAIRLTRELIQLRKRIYGTRTVS